MKDVRYTGTSDTYTISADEWKAAGISSKDTVWKPGETIEVANAAAELLAKSHPHEFDVKGVDTPEDALRAAESDAVAGTGGEGGGVVSGGGGTITGGLGTAGTTAGPGGTTSAGTTGSGTTSSSTGR